MNEIIMANCSSDLLKQESGTLTLEWRLNMFRFYFRFHDVQKQNYLNIKHNVQEPLPYTGHFTKPKQNPVTLPIHWNEKLTDLTHRVYNLLSVSWTKVGRVKFARLYKMGSQPRLSKKVNLMEITHPAKVRRQMYTSESFHGMYALVQGENHCKKTIYRTAWFHYLQILIVFYLMHC